MWPINASLLTCLVILTLLVLKTEYSEIVRLIPWLMMPDQQQLSHCTCSITQIARFVGPMWAPSWVLLAPDGPHVGPKNLAIRVMTRPCPPLEVLWIIGAFGLSRDYKYTNKYFRFNTNSIWQELMASITWCQYQQSVVNVAPPVFNTNYEQSTRFIMCWHCMHFTATSLYGVTYWFIDAHGRQWTGLLWFRVRISDNLFIKFVAHYLWHISKSSITWTDAG